ncbi:MAG: DUF3536 domain-containing protein [Candidatus Sumerlaea chitinivorans]|nr:DUF3536 domain-containing protein [Candidatus Sumerlaea chitinivorans]
MKPNRYICIHGHFYQPPRENPWLEAIEQQDSAQPYHDWNERITAECYAPNTSSRILDSQGKIERIINNYERISFNFGPTLLSWLETHARETYLAILEADRLSAARFSGHGSAMAQVYNHLIMPLASRRDKITQVRWGIADFVHRFGRRPEGMWLAETAVDLETLDIMASHGIRFTILSPHQAARVRPLARGSWTDVRGGRIDPSRPYLCRLPSGASISIFFYDAPISHAVAFEGLLFDGHAFANRLMSGFAPDRDGAQLVHIATDGESYGHHHKFGEMALSRCLCDIEHSNRVALTNYGEFLEHFPPRYEVEIFEATSWSCAHGVGRWSYDCGCNTGGHPGWNQAWRAPLRAAMNWLRDEAVRIYEEHGTSLFPDLWLARDNYIDVILNRSRDALDRFFLRYARAELTAEERIKALQLLEMQRNALLMFTSCGWFFDDISGIETVQNLLYAARVIQLARELSGVNLEPRFLAQLEQARSNIPAFVNGAIVYERLVRPHIVDLRKVAANHAILMVAEDAPATGHLYAYEVEATDTCKRTLGERSVLAGIVKVRSTVTLQEETFMFASANLGEHKLEARLAPYEPEAYRQLQAHLTAEACDLTLEEGLDFLATLLPEPTYALPSLFRDKMRRIVYRLLGDPIQTAIEVMEKLYEENAPLMRFLRTLDVPLPKVLATMSQFVLNHLLQRAIETENDSPETVRARYQEALSWNVELDAGNLSYALERVLNRLADELRVRPNDVALMQRLVGITEVAISMPFPVNLWRPQNIFYHIASGNYRITKTRADSGDREAKKWTELCQQLATMLHVRLS